MKQKLLLVALIVLCASVTTKAQITKGAVWLGGNLSYSQKTTDPSSSTETRDRSYSISPAIGIAVKDNTILGIQLNYTKSRTTYNGSDLNASVNKNYGAGVFLRRYMPVVNRLYLFGQADAGFGIERDSLTVTYNNERYKTKGWTAALSFSPGISFAATKKLHLEAGFNDLFSLGYSKSKTTTNYSTYNSKTESFSTGINLENRSGFFVGVRFLLTK